MRAVDIIGKKRDRQSLTKEEIDFFVRGLTDGSIPDYQVSAWAMAVLLNGMSPDETAVLTMSMAYSGQVLDLSGVVPIAIDKHSTGGVGDKTTFVVEPTVAACGLPVGKMSGRGLGFSGGTLDKIESIPGYRTNLSNQEFVRQLGEIGLVLTGQSADLAPADGKLYALRDVTATVQSIPLIASSVMSKKIAAGAQAIVLDVKTGIGAFMTSEPEARELAELMVSIGKMNGRRVIGVLSNMNQPLGKAIGNALELKEAIDSLHGGGPVDFREHCLALSSYMLVLGKKAVDLGTARSMAESAISTGKAWDAFRRLVIAQQGDVRFIEDPTRLPMARLIKTIFAPNNGWISQINARMVGETSVLLGAGRARKGDPVDPAVGIVLAVKVGDPIEQEQPLLTIHANSEEKMAQAEKILLEAISISEHPVIPLPLFYGIVGELLTGA